MENRFHGGACLSAYSFRAMAATRREHTLPRPPATLICHGKSSLTQMLAYSNTISKDPRNVVYGSYEHREHVATGLRRLPGLGSGGRELERAGACVTWCTPRHIRLHLMNKTSCTTYRKDESGPPVSVEGYLQSLDPVVQH